MRSGYEKDLDRQLLTKKSVSPNDSVVHNTVPDNLSDNDMRSSSNGMRGSMRSNLKKTVRFQVYNATNLNSIQEMRKKKLEDLNRFSLERHLQ